MDKRIVRAAVVVAAVGSLAACGPDKATEKVRPGTYCQQAGQRAVTDAGRPVVCTTTGSDDRLRWRADR